MSYIADINFNRYSKFTTGSISFSLKINSLYLAFVQYITYYFYRFYRFKNMTYHRGQRMKQFVPQVLLNISATLVPCFSPNAHPLRHPSEPGTSINRRTRLYTGRPCVRRRSQWDWGTPRFDMNSAYSYWKRSKVEEFTKTNFYKSIPSQAKNVVKIWKSTNPPLQKSWWPGQQKCPIFLTLYTHYSLSC